MGYDMTARGTTPPAVAPYVEAALAHMQGHMSNADYAGPKADYADTGGWRWSSHAGPYYSVILDDIGAPGVLDGMDKAGAAAAAAKIDEASDADILAAMLEVPEFVCVLCSAFGDTFGGGCPYPGREDPDLVLSEVRGFARFLHAAANADGYEVA